MGEAGGRDPETRRGGAANHFLRPRGRRKVVVFGGQAEEDVAHRPADEAGFRSIAVERLKRAPERAACQGRDVPKPSAVQSGQRPHSIRPGTSTPFSSCAGT